MEYIKTLRISETLYVMGLRERIALGSIPEQNLVKVLKNEALAAGISNADAEEFAQETERKLRK